MVDNNNHVFNLKPHCFVPATERPDGRLQFYCVYCKKIHIHGSGYGHRIAHCVRDTPYSKNGYWLVPNTEAVGAAITN